MSKGIKLRITWESKDGTPDIEEYDNCVFGFKFYSKEIYIDAEGVGELNVKKIVKIEKQVKDLTLEECYQLDIDYNSMFHEKGIIIGTDDLIIKNFDDYIDITKIVKWE